MRNWILFSAFIYVLTFCVSVPVFASNIVTHSIGNERTKNQALNDNGDEINALLLNCRMSENSSKKSFAAVLKFTNEDGINGKYDIAITTGHGLFGEGGERLNNCFVSYPGGAKFPVTDAKLAPNYQPGTPSDWAVIVFPKIHQERLIRYTVSNNISQKSFEAFSELRPSVLFSTARGMPVNGQSCEIEPRRIAGLRHQNFIGFLSHTCRAIAGQSGTPISVIRNQQPVLIGIHIGSSMVYGYPTLDTPLYYRGYMREIDTEFMAEFSKILTSLSTKPQ